MADEKARDVGRDLWRWLILAALLVAGLTAYFLYAPRVPPVVHPAQSEGAP
jgi:uncharacterized BrkB/YihY/UPF0761 family membrane protein